LTSSSLKAKKIKINGKEYRVFDEIIDQGRQEELLILTRKLQDDSEITIQDLGYAGKQDIVFEPNAMDSAWVMYILPAADDKLEIEIAFVTNLNKIVSEKIVVVGQNFEKGVLLIRIRDKHETIEISKDDLINAFLLAQKVKGATRKTGETRKKDTDDYSFIDEMFKSKISSNDDLNELKGLFELIAGIANGRR
jgi:hypothetical protein